MAVKEPPICPECGQPLAVPERRVGPIVVCPACLKSVSLKAAAAIAAAGGRAGSRRQTPNLREAPPQQQSLVWIVQTSEGRPAASLAKADLDRRVEAGEFDARTLVKRQDWSEAKPLADLYQGLAVACSAKPVVATAVVGGDASPLSQAAAPWAAVPQPPMQPPPRPAQPPDRLRSAKIFLLVGAIICGLWAFHGALGDSTVQPAISRRVLFLMFATYWMAAWLLAAALFGWRLESPQGEPRGLHRLLGVTGARWLLAAAGVGGMALIIWIVA